MRTEGVFYAAPNVVQVREYEIGDPDLYEVQIELKAAGLCAWDLALFQGNLYPGVSFPFLHGHEGAGIVTKVGARVQGFKEGDKVTAMGNDSKLMGHMANVPAQYVVKIADDVEDFQYWIAEPASCVANGMEWCPVIPGDRVAVVGTGFMGLMFVQALRYSLASEVVAIDVDAQRLALAKEFGADQIINLTTAEGKEQVEALKRNRLDLTIECAGNQAAFQLSYEILRRAGRMNLFSAQRGDPRAANLAMWHGLGIQLYATSPSIAPDFPRIFARTVPLIARGVFDLHPLFTHTMPAERAQELFDIAVGKTEGYIKGAICW